jgi:hypothetical protein
MSYSQSRGEINPYLVGRWSVPNGWLGSNDRLESLGVVVCSSAIMNWTYTWTQPKLCAFALAHELGHAIGLGRITHNYNLMYPAVDTSCSWDDATRFVLNTSPNVRANLRWLLGRESVVNYRDNVYYTPNWGTR